MNLLIQDVQIKILSYVQPKDIVTLYHTYPTMIQELSCHVGFLVSCNHIVLSDEIIHFFQQKQIPFQLFESFVIETYLFLLQPQNNSYKYALNYISHIQSFQLQETKCYCQCMVYILTSIKNEQNKYRHHTNDAIAYPIQKSIIQDCLTILWHEKYVSFMLEKINLTFQYKISPEFYKKHCHIYGFPPHFYPVAHIYDLNYLNMTPIYDVLSTLKRIHSLINHHSSNELLEDCYDYLSCLCYFSKTE
jgi:hypothetical protein